MYSINIDKNIEKTKLKVYILLMTCSKCKKKNMIKQESKKEFNIFDKMATWAIITWFFLGLYGGYSLIKNLINLFK